MPTVIMHKKINIVVIEFEAITASYKYLVIQNTPHDKDNHDITPILGSSTPYTSVANYPRSPHDILPTLILSDDLTRVHKVDSRGYMCGKLCRGVYVSSLSLPVKVSCVHPSITLTPIRQFKFCYSNTLLMRTMH